MKFCFTSTLAEVFKDVLKYSEFLHLYTINFIFVNFKILFSSIPLCRFQISQITLYDAFESPRQKKTVI